jgi:hypothetical protein
MFLTRELFLAT